MTLAYDHYRKDGTVYNIYTHAPAQLIPENQIATFCDLTEKEFKAAVKKFPLPKPFHDSTEKDYLDFELTTWLNKVRRSKELKPTWKGGLEVIKRLTAVDRREILDELKRELNHPWSRQEMFERRFTDTHLKGYKEGIADAIAIIVGAGVITNDYFPFKGDIVLVGTRLGVVKYVKDECVIVEGATPHPTKEIDHWELEYKTSDIVAKRPRLVWESEKDPDQKVGPFIWEYTDIPFIQRDLSKR